MRAHKPSLEGTSQPLGSLTFHVPGLPAGKGSMRFAGMNKDRPVLKADNSTKLRSWSKAVSDMATFSRRGAFFAKGTPVSVVAEFHLPTDKPELWGEFATTDQRFDLDKLLRAALDALTGVIWKDDGQVVECHVWKFWESPARAGAVFSIQRAEDGSERTKSDAGSSAGAPVDRPRGDAVR